VPRRHVRRAAAARALPDAGGPEEAGRDAEELLRL